MKDTSDNRAFVFIDLLGFKNYVDKNINDAWNLLFNIHIAIEDAISDTKSVGRYDSFENLIPMSDSIVITSTNPDKLIEQLSVFLLTLFNNVSQDYKNPENPNNPMEITKTNHIFAITNNKIEIKNSVKYKQNQYPPLFRGGISYGDVIIFDTNSIKLFKMEQTRNILGVPFIESYKLESLPDSPSILLSEKFYKELKNKVSKKYIAKKTINKKSYHELLWPGYFFEETGLSSILVKFQEIFIPAYNLWIFFKNEKYANKYSNLLKLIYKSFIRSIEGKENFQIAKEQVENYIIKNFSDIVIKNNKMIIRPTYYRRYRNVSSKSY